MGNNKSKNLNKEQLNNQLQFKTEEDNNIIINLEIYNYNKENEIYILCDKNKLLEDYKNEYFFRENKINPPKEFNFFNKENTKLYLNNKEIEFNYKLKFNKIGVNNIKIKSNIKLFSLYSMFYNCNQIINIKFIKINTYYVKI